MIPIYYKSSEGEIVNLIEAPYRMLTNTELLNSSWEWETVGTNYPKIAKLKKALISPPFSIRVSGNSKDDMRNNLEHIESVFDRDCFLGEMGRLYIGEFYRECFITSSTKEKVFEKTHTTVGYVATSNNGYWKNNKTVSFSGTGALQGEIASSAYVSAHLNNEYLSYTPNEDGTATISYSSQYSSVGRNDLMFDLGDVIDVESLSGLMITDSPTQPDAECDVQISEGEIVADARTQTLTSGSESSRINVVDFDTIVVDDIVANGWTLQIKGYINYGLVETIDVKTSTVDIIGEDIDVSDFDYFTFYGGYSTEGSHTTVEYTVNEVQWTTVDTISVSGSTAEVTLEDVTCQYIRLKGAYFGNVNGTVSIISGETMPNRDMLRLGYQAENCELVKHQGNSIEFLLQTGTGYVNFDDTSVTLKKIECNQVSGVVIVQGYNNNQWTDIVQLSNELDQSYNTTYEKIRIVLPTATSNPWANQFKIWVQTNARIVNNSYAPSDAIIRLQGPWNNPSINIGDIDYGARVNLASGHTLEIDTKEMTVYDITDADQSKTNVFDKRIAETFTQVESGEHSVEWASSVTGIEITLEQARSTPKWN